MTNAQRNMVAKKKETKRKEKYKPMSANFQRHSNIKERIVQVERHSNELLKD